MNLQQLALKLYDMGFNVAPGTIQGDVKRPYIPTEEKPLDYKHFKKLRISRNKLDAALKIAAQQNKLHFIALFPGRMYDTKTEAKYSWGIDFDDPKNIELLGITTQWCKTNGIWIEKSLSKGYHLYGIASTQLKWNKELSLGIELFTDDSYFIAIYNKFQHELYDMKYFSIGEAHNTWKKKLSEIKKIPIIEKKDYIQRALEAAQGVAEGNRDLSAYDIGRLWKNTGFPEEQAIEEIVEWNKLNKQPETDIEKLKQQVIDAYHYKQKRKEEKEITIEPRRDKYYGGHSMQWIKRFTDAIPENSQLKRMVALCIAEAIQHQYKITKGKTTIFLTTAALKDFEVNSNRMKPYLLLFQKDKLIKVSFKIGRAPKIELLFLPTSNNTNNI